MNNRTKKIFTEGKNMDRKETVYCELDNNIYIFSDKTLQHRRQLCMDSFGETGFPSGGLPWKMPEKYAQ